MLWKRLLVLENIVNQEIENAVLNNAHETNKVVYVNQWFLQSHQVI